jgi:hypothetical protein
MTFFAISSIAPFRVFHYLSAQSMLQRLQVFTLELFPSGRQFSRNWKSDGLVMAYREKQPQRTIAQITGWSPRAISYKLPAALLDLSNVLDKADLL